MNRQELAKESRRKQLIEATLRAIGKVGYSSATLLHVANEAGLSPSIVNFYFKSKEQLLLATLEQITQDYATHWQAAIAKGKIAPAAGLDAIIDLDFQSHVCNPERISIWYAFWSEAQNNAAYRIVISKLEAEYVSETETLCARLAAEGGYDGDPRAIANGLNALIDGLWFDCLIDPQHFNREDAKEICRLFLSGLFPDHFSMKRAGNAPTGAQTYSFTADHQGKDAHRARLAAALRKRLEPIGPMRKQALIAALDITPKTLENWLDGKAEPSSWQMGRLIAVTDAQLWLEIYGPVQAEIQRRYDARLAQLEQEMRQERAALESLANPKSDPSA